MYDLGIDMDGPMGGTPAPTEDQSEIGRETIQVGYLSGALVNRDGRAHIDRSFVLYPTIDQLLEQKGVRELREKLRPHTAGNLVEKYIESFIAELESNPEKVELRALRDAGQWLVEGYSLLKSMGIGLLALECYSRDQKKEEQ